MAEARSEEEEESLRRETREQVVRRQPNSSGGRPDRRKPEHRHSQGPLSSIRAVIKRTSTRPTSLSETPRDRDRDRDRRRPEITVLSAEPLASTSWFPGAAGGFPPPPPPAAQIWGSTIPPAVQPPPSYEEVIREKTQEQDLLPSSSSSSSALTRPVSTITISTQTDPGPGPDPQTSRGKRPVRPPRPPLLPSPRSSDDIASSQPTLSCLNTADTHPETLTHPSENTQPSENTHPETLTPRRDLFAEPCSASTSAAAAQTDQWDRCVPAVDAAASPSDSTPVSSARPRPRPRTKLGLRSVSSEVKVQTLVKLREDGAATLAARSAGDEPSQGKYLQELLEAFSSDDWGYPEDRGGSGEPSQSESEEEDGEDMATLKARIQAFEQQQLVEGSCDDNNERQNPTGEPFVVTKRPEPRPRPHLQGQPTKPAPPTTAPKPKNFSPGLKPSSKVFWEDGGLTAEPGCSETTDSPPDDLLKPRAETPTPSGTKLPPGSEPQSSRTPEKPSITPKPKSIPDATSSGTPALVPSPRPPPPKATPSLSGPPSQLTPRPPPRPLVAPRVSLGAPGPEKSSMEVVGGARTEPPSEALTVKGSIRPSLPTKPTALTSPRRASAPSLTPKPISVSQSAPDPSLTPTKPQPPAAPKAPAPAPTKPPAPAPAPRTGSVGQTKTGPPDAANPNSDPPLPPRPSSVKLLPLRPPPIKSIPGRPPPPSISSASSANQIAAPPAAPPTAPPTRSVSPASQPPSSPSSSSSGTTNQKAVKRGPPLPPRPRPGHPLYNTYGKQDVLIVLDDARPAPSEDEGQDGTSPAPLIESSQCLLDLDPRPDQDQDGPSKPALGGLDPSESQCILPEQPAGQKEQPDPPPVSGPRCVAAFDYEGEEDDELTFSQGDVIALLELVGRDWGRGRIHGRVGMFPLSFTEVAEPLPPPSPPETDQPAPADAETASDAPRGGGEWVVALFDFPGQTAEDLSFQKGALIRVTEHVDAAWRRGRLDGKEGLYPSSFTQPRPAPPVSDQRATAMFDFTAASEDELTLKVGDVITQVESVDEQWILGVVGGKRGIVPRNYVSLV